MPDRCASRCSTVTSSAISGRSPPSSERAVVSRVPAAVGHQRHHRQGGEGLGPAGDREDGLGGVRHLPAPVGQAVGTFDERLARTMQADHAGERRQRRPRRRELSSEAGESGMSSKRRDARFRFSGCGVAFVLRDTARPVCREERCYLRRAPMTTRVAFLRAVNLGKRRVAMARLKAVCEDLGYASGVHPHQQRQRGVRRDRLAGVHRVGRREGVRGRVRFRMHDVRPDRRRTREDRRGHAVRRRQRRHPLRHLPARRRRPRPRSRRWRDSRTTSRRWSSPGGTCTG